ncbi:Methylmalonyl-CoA epimerase OS=Tsukamurella paurometabola (strain ATCC 8368 / DSM / CCUG 35730/ CIP 100753 / JCM 10117 / KCTC 9821 / NBRC 16120 / NCIMB 702349 / NCTC 13040) OX=521096 GN=Tpau_1264 PE=3 SV=1 [Tsukamurella paurometabola]|uniref:Methylmalonyl-CoA epimerase n=1 Tax=Tsukamurella paurometabola (strain ATCC 8368 / DSM 20162 / CCUG 35730 / CIP 100753 / JCM 10117 / KCTC 9821 / NBRC 16120 / NCIMB 702349 / NCTC 13040) TaxID=521096 RepID=D5UWM3_TSUPD|nr:methylmalonyl-CoA epimerase [Tsukamurella paurometabola]ADG77895.1 methylmalonyl-CoA epimerase [Tsukamurella paurometabola DSM 20162]SUP29246.1 4-hydroxyphenylpyruvate dioxygenase and related hemolysins [Tsukamurella paurometabola]
MTASQSHPGAHPAAADLPAQYVLGIDHVGVAVADLDEAVQWYARVLGFVCTHEEINEAQGVREAMLSPAKLLAEGAEPAAAAQLQVLAPLTPESTIAKFLDRNGPGMQQLAYRVSDLDKVTAHLRDQGVRLLYDAPRNGTAGSRINFVHPKDAGGILVELVEPAAAH